MQISLLTLLVAYLAAPLLHALHEAGDGWPPLIEMHASGEVAVVQSDADVVPFDWYVPLSEPIVPEPSISHLVSQVNQSRF